MVGAVSLKSHRTVDDLAAIVSRLGAEFALTAADYDAKAEFPAQNIKRLHETGLLSLTIPTSLGGAGSGLAEAVQAVSGIAKGEPSTGLVLALQYVTNNRVTTKIPFGERIARSIVSEGALINILRVEKDLGTPVRGGLPSATARRVPGGWRITASKLYSTGSHALSWLGVWAKSDDAEPLVGRMQAKGLKTARLERVEK